MEEQEKKPARIGKVVQQATVTFAGAEITAVLAEDGLVYGALPHLCRALDLNNESQQERIEELRVLAKGLRQFQVIQEQGKQLITLWCLQADLIPYWLALVPTGRMKSDKKARLDFYQDEVADVLRRLFGGMAGQSSPGVSLADQHPTYAEGLAIARMALDQAQLANQKSDETSEEVKALKAVYDARIATLEARLMPRATLDEEQAERISDLVKQAGIALSQKMGGGNYLRPTLSNVQCHQL